ncbi:glycosyltransferase [Aquibacillus halophilus]|uniref:Glycosyltransferase n=1 Tax=Aquibacillus halophilus TaxID=930132 RepID=A0A6A8DBT9_9BACI|nr:glycosyltransferase [Aquibacillus halophilus]MRH41231.1 glycosyltransferase [Aquibacillus halophilus]
MRIMVFDVPAESGGALTILNQYYDAALNNTKIEWIFVVSNPKLKEQKNVRVLNYPWIKKSWFHRLYFDKFVAHKLVNKYEVNEVLSLQNVLVPKVQVKQTLYLHQPLPFVEKQYGITENFKFWVYQNVVNKMIYKSIRKADKVIVQTKWIMNAAIRNANVEKEKFILKQPEFNVKVKKFYSKQDNEKVIFFYPSSGLEYKNHKVVVEAIRNLSNVFLDKCEVIFTLKGDENKHIQELQKIIYNNSLPIKFIGSLSINEVYDYYSKSILIFPSYIETFGLPMLEAKMHKTPIIASHTSFSKEVLNGYEKVDYFPYDDPKALERLMKKHLISQKQELYNS